MDALTFQTAVRRIEKLMYRVGMSYLGNGDDVADAVQDALATAWKKRRHLKKPEQFKPWMMRILTNRCIDMLRKRKRVSFFPFEDDTVVVEMPSQLSPVMEAVSSSWWIDHFWVNGQCMDMAANSGSEEHGSEVPGEIVRTEYRWLDNINVALNGKVEIALPIGERQPLDEYSFLQHPEKYDEDRQLMKPDKGLATFTFDAKDTLKRMLTFVPEQETVTPDVTLKVQEATFTPLMTYITLEMQQNAESVAAYKAEHGEGFYGEDGTLLWEYTGADLYGGWLSSMQLADGDGCILFPEHWGNNGYSADWAEFTYPYMDVQALPEELWLAPVEDGGADMMGAFGSSKRGERI